MRATLIDCSIGEQEIDYPDHQGYEAIGTERKNATGSGESSGTIKRDS